MKKKLCSIMCLCSLVSIMLCACGKQQIGTNTERSDSGEEGAETETLKAKILELDDAFILVEPLEGSPELNSADKINIPNEGNIDFHIGDEIEIEYSGGILESYPAQLGEVYNIKVTKETVDFQTGQSSQQEK